jgi:hypothetical protein
VPADHVGDDDDIHLRTRALPVLESYKRRRTLHLGEGKPGALVFGRRAVQ